MTEINKDSLPEFLQKYVSLVKDDPIDMLKQQKESFSAFIDNLSEGTLDFSYGEGKWTLREVITHMVDTEQIFGYRALCIARGEEGALPGFDQDVYISKARLTRHTKEYLANYFTITRYSTLILFNGTDDSLWERMGHMSGYTLPLKAIPHVIAGHHAHHMNIIDERYLQA